MSVLHIPYGSPLDKKLEDIWASLEVFDLYEWTMFVKDLDDKITRVYMPIMAHGGETVVEFATDQDKTMFLLKWI